MKNIFCHENDILNNERGRNNGIEMSMVREALKASVWKAINIVVCNGMDDNKGCGTINIANYISCHNGTSYRGVAWHSTRARHRVSRHGISLERGIVCLGMAWHGMA